ncbi:alpha-2 adrenergic receptor [Trichonephila clavipes]|nr:alpha-2 adrenergic receptor [Trichonephila clavipes]
MKIGNNRKLILGPFDESTPCLMIVLMNCQTKLRINHLAAVKSVAILESNANLNFHTWKKHSLPPAFHWRTLKRHKSFKGRLVLEFECFIKDFERVAVAIAQGWRTNSTRVIDGT